MLGAKKKSRAYLNLITHVKTVIATLRRDFVLLTSYLIQADKPGVENFKQRREVTHNHQQRVHKLGLESKPTQQLLGAA